MVSGEEGKVPARGDLREACVSCITRIVSQELELHKQTHKVGAHARLLSVDKHALASKVDGATFNDDGSRGHGGTVEAAIVSSLLATRTLTE
jgi:hypothetical protein